LKLKFWAFKAVIDRPMHHSVRQLPIERFSERVRGSVQKFGDWDMHPYSFEPYFKNMGIQAMHDSTFERETYHVSSNGKLEKSTSCEQFCGCSKKQTRAGAQKNSQPTTSFN
jgi:hypothetical protein